MESWENEGKSVALYLNAAASGSESWHSVDLHDFISIMCRTCILVPYKRLDVRVSHVVSSCVGSTMRKNSMLILQSS